MTCIAYQSGWNSGRFRQWRGRTLIASVLYNLIGCPLPIFMFMSLFTRLFLYLLLIMQDLPLEQHAMMPTCNLVETMYNKWL